MRTLASIWAIILSVSCFAQFGDNYKPANVHDEESKTLIRDFRRNALAKAGAFPHEDMGEIMRTTMERIIDRIKGEKYIDDEYLQGVCDTILQRLVENNTIRNTPERILLSRDPIINAFSIGEGSLELSTGLLSRVRTESELAFIIAHELAHYEREHFLMGFMMRNIGKREASKEANKLGRGKISDGGLQTIQNYVYGQLRYSRGMEIEADSFAIRYMQNAGFNDRDGLRALDILDSARYPKYPLGDSLFLVFNFREYPFKVEWLRNKTDGYERNPSHTQIFRNDSLNTHPNIPLRKERMARLFDVDYERIPDRQIERFIKTCEFENVRSSYFSKQLDNCLHEAIQLKTRYPENAYLTTMIGRALLATRAAKIEGSFIYYVYPITSNFKEERRRVNNFLYNLKQDDHAQIAFYFMNHKSNFNKEDEDHYFLLWQASKATNRKITTRQVRDVYLKKFPEGKYVTDMK